MGMILLIRKRTLLYTWLAVCMIGLSAIFLAGSRRAFTPTGAMGQGSRVQTVVIDPGHGGQDGGAVGGDGTAEKDLNLDIARRLAEFYEISGYEVVMTRTEDVSLGAEGFDKVKDMKARLQLIRDNPDCLFISIHLNKFTQSRYWGAQVFYSSNHPESQRLAESIQQSIQSDRIADICG
mgnify:CR=1 FL=1